MNHNKEAKSLTFWRGSEVSQGFIAPVMEFRVPLDVSVLGRGAWVSRTWEFRISALCSVFWGGIRRVFGS